MAQTSKRAKHTKLRHRRNIQEGMAGLKKNGIKSPAWFHGQGGTFKSRSKREKA